MELLFRKLSKPKSVAEKIEYLIRNLDEFYLQRIHEGLIHTIGDLECFCEGLERSREILKRRKFNQYPLAEPSLQGRHSISRVKVNEVNFENSWPKSEAIQRVEQCSESGHFDKIISSDHASERHNDFSDRPFPTGHLPVHNDGIPQPYSEAPSSSWQVSGQFEYPPNFGSGQAASSTGRYCSYQQPLRASHYTDQNHVNRYGMPYPFHTQPILNPNNEVSDFAPRSMPNCAVINELSGKCFNCKKSGHRWINCTLPKRFFCHRCGLEGKAYPSCPRCTGNRIGEPRS